MMRNQKVLTAENPSNELIALLHKLQALKNYFLGTLALALEEV